MSQSQPEGLSATIGSLRVKALTVVSESDTLRQVASALRTHNASCAVLKEPPFRLITEAALVKAWAEGRSGQEPVGQMDCDQPSWVSVTSSVAEAANLMVRLGISHLVILDQEGALSGVVTMAQLFSVLVHSQEPMALYAHFATIMTEGASAFAEGSFAGIASEITVGTHLLGATE